jgi:hypothetical protein
MQLMEDVATIYRCEGIPPDPDKSSLLPPKNTMILYVKETIHFFIYYITTGNYDGGLRFQISNQLPLILCPVSHRATIA